MSPWRRKRASATAQVDPEPRAACSARASARETDVQIPRKLSQIWIGPRTPPTAWMQSWRDKHPDWDYTLYDNAYLGETTFRNRAILDEYLRRGEYAGAADIMRYEILFRTGGFMPEADSICLENTEELFPAPAPTPSTRTSSCAGSSCRRSSPASPATRSSASWSTSSPGSVRPTSTAHG